MSGHLHSRQSARVKKQHHETRAKPPLAEVIMQSLRPAPHSFTRSEKLSLEVP